MYEDPFGAYMNLRKNVYALSDKIEGFAVNSSNTCLLYTSPSPRDRG